MDNISYNHELNIFVQVDAIKSMSDDGDHWIFEGIASTADMDLYNEVVYPESFLDSIEFFKNNGKIFFDHDYAKQNADWLKDHGFSKDEILAIRTPIGKPLDAKVTKDGLHIRAMLNKSHPMARLMWNQYLNNGDENFRDQLGLSIGAKYLGQPRKEFDVRKGKHVTYLPDLLLYEVSLTPEPVNPHTKSWAATLKSFMKDADQEIGQNENYHKLEPDSIVFDDENNRMVVKSVVEDADGVVHTFESTINLKEDIKKSMEKEDIAMENVVDSVESADMVEVDTQKATPEEMQQMAAQQGEEAQAAPEDGESAAPEGEMDGAPEESGMDEEGATSVLEELAAESEEEAAEGDSEMAQDDSMSMMLDKMDTVLDALGNLTDMLQNLAPEGEPAGEQVTTETPSLDMGQMKSVVFEAVEEVLKSIQVENPVIEDVSSSSAMELSEESAVMLAETIKSAIVSAEESLVSRVVERVLEETVVTKSVQDEVSRVVDDVVHPGAVMDGAGGNDVDAQVMKSVSGNAGASEFTDEQMDTLKSMVSEYIDIRGYTADKSQQRAKIIERAQGELGLHPSLFNVYVNKAHKGKF